MGIPFSWRSQSRPLTVDENRDSKDRTPDEESDSSGERADPVGMAAFLDRVLSNEARARRLNNLVLTVAIGVSLIVATFAILLLAFGSSRVGIRVSEVCGSFASVVVAVTAVVHAVKGSRRRK